MTPYCRFARPLSTSFLEAPTNERAFVGQDVEQLELCAWSYSPSVAATCRSVGTGSYSSCNRVIESFDHVHPSAQQFVIRDVLLGPSFQNVIDSEALGSTKFLFIEVSVVDCLPDEPDFFVSYAKMN